MYVSLVIRERMWFMCELRQQILTFSREMFWTTLSEIKDYQLRGPYAHQTLILWFIRAGTLPVKDTQDLLQLILTTVSATLHLWMLTVNNATCPGTYWISRTPFLARQVKARNIHAVSGIRTYDPGIQAAENLRQTAWSPESAKVTYYGTKIKPEALSPSLSPWHLGQGHPLPKPTAQGSSTEVVQVRTRRV
jgi:hypothetical protein